MKSLLLLALACCLAFPVSAQRPEPGTTSALYKEVSTENFRRIKAAGIQWVEIAINQCYRGVPMEQIVPRIEAMKAMADSAGMKVWSIHLPFSRTLDISVLNDSLRRENVAFMAKMIRRSAIFSPQRLVLHPSSEPIREAEREKRLALAIGSIRELKEAADAIGAELCIENLPRTCLGNTPEELVRIVDAVPGVGICFDTNHYVQGTTAHFMNLAGKRIRTLHCSDFDLVNECHWLPTQGQIDWAELTRKLEEIGYDGVFMYEATKDQSTKERLRPEQIMESFRLIYPDRN